jgi:hypothetical protein
MLRNFGISLLLFGLLAAGIDGFRVRERANARVGNGTENAVPTTTEEDLVHSAEMGVFPPK